MKLQLTPQALRLRLADDEMQEFAQAGQLSHTLHLGGQGLTYTLRRLPPDAPEGLAVRYEAGAVVVLVPAVLARQLIDGTTISMKSEVAGTDGRLLRILIEKDLGPSH
ncbi:MAG: hypothetical protein EOO56_23480 [Hymenobacter sp.]|nr:MAG: hypothetical protein EOO56_23480 [Hymenobacter sp.]